MPCIDVYKRQVKAFEKIEKRFNETHDDIHLTISSPNEAMTILKTRFIREDYPDIIAICLLYTSGRLYTAGDCTDPDELRVTKRQCRLVCCCGNACGTAVDAERVL